MTAADLVITGRIATLAGDAGFGWVEAIAIRNGRVIASGTIAEIQPLVAARTEQIALAPDEAAMPGMTDAHLHLAEGALSAGRLDLTQSPTLDDALSLVAERHAALDPDGWLEGHGWDADRWGGWPRATDLDRAARGRRVAIWAHDHHSLWVSDAALRAGGVTAATDDPPGGMIRRADDGAPTGVLLETASRLVFGAIPRPSPDELMPAIEALGRELLAVGVVAAHDPGALSPQSGLGPAFEAYRRLSDAGRLPIRVHASVRHEQLAAAIDAGIRSGDPIGDANGRAHIGWLKLFGDGTLGSRTAALLEPIEDEPGHPLPPGTERGVFLTTPEQLAELAGRAAGARISCQIHGIGDAAVRAALDALAPTAGRTRLSPRIEHVQLVAPDDLGRFAAQHIAASVQPVHLRGDAEVARRLWGRRAEAFGYPLASLVRGGAVVAFGTDAPVESIDPWPGLAMAVTRRDPGWAADVPAFGPAEALTLAEALRAACVAPAVLAAEGADRGRLVPGHRADVVVVPRAALEEPAEPGGALTTARPRLVLVDGVVAFEA